jgi:UDP-glucuronate decarboxylase
MTYRKILITGGAGNVGGSLAKALVKNPDNLVYIADDLSTGSLLKLPSKEYKNWKFIKCNVNNYTDISGIMLSQQFDYVFHYAAVVGVERTLENPVKVLDDIDGLKNILTLCKNTFVKRVYFSSSSEVYGEPVEFPQNEDTTPLNSKLPYAVVKNIGEAFLKSYHKEYGLNYTIFRFFNTYGPDQSVDFVVPKFIQLALNNKPITLYGDGLQTRTFCYVNDNIETTLATLNNDLAINDTMNVGSDSELSVLGLAKMIIKMTNSSSSIVHLPALVEGDMTRRKPDISKMKSILNRNLTPIEEGLTKTIDFIRSNAAPKLERLKS